MKTISFESFSNCFSLNGTLTIPSSVEQIENYAFKGTIFEKIIFMWTENINCEGLIGFKPGSIVYVQKEYNSLIIFVCMMCLLMINRNQRKKCQLV